MMHNPKTIINRIRDIRENSEYDATIRSFVNIGFGGILVAFALGIYYLVLGENNVLNGMLILISGVQLTLFMVLGLATLQMELAAFLSSVWVSFVLFPGSFFLGGGMYSGAPIWFLMGFAYVSLVLSGKKRVVLFILQLIVFSASFFVSYDNPNLTINMDSFSMAIDSLVSVAVVGPAISIMFFFREVIMRKEQQFARAQKNEIERLTKSQQDFFSSMSRKIRTPIGGITGLTEMILRSENLAEEVRGNTKNIVSASDMLLTIIEDLIDMNKMQIGDISIENVEYDSALLFIEVSKMLEPKAAEKGLEFTMDIAPDFPVGLFGDKVRMKQILVNIINNAIKYTRDGSVKFSARTESVGGSLINAIYRIEDTGIGIKEENIDTLFSDFSRIDLDVNRKIEGTGLGLSIVKGIVTAMGGRVLVESTFGKGSVFTVILPQTKNGEETIGNIDNYKGKENIKEKNRFKAKDGRILIVDDDRMSREVVKKLLLNTEATIDVCENGREALILTAENFYNIIFMDHVMPGMDGVEAFHRIRTQINGKNRQTPIVALTANAGENLKEVYQNIGFAGYLSKPVNVALLEEYVIESMPEGIIEFNSHSEESGIAHYNLKNKVPVMITTDSTAGVSPEAITRYGIEILPYCISMSDGSSFVERTEIDIEAMRAVQNTEKISEEVVNIEMAEAFFREQLKKAENVIHVCLMYGDVSLNYQRLCGVADKVGHVTVFESGTVSVGAGLMAARAAKLASEGHQMIDVINELIDLRKKIEFRTRIGEVNLLVDQRRFPKLLGGVFKMTKIHPLIKTIDSKLTMYGFMSEKSSMVSFVDRVLREKIQYEDDIYIAHPDVRNNRDEIKEIVELIKKRGGFSNVEVIQSSPIIVANSGMNSLAVAMVKKHE